MCAQPIGNHYAGYGAVIDDTVWESSTSKAVYAHFWTTSQPGPMNKFFDGVADALQARQMEVTYHRTNSKSYGEFGMQCRRCGMSLVISWPRSLTDAEVEDAQQLLAAFAHPQPFQFALLDKMPDEKEPDVHLADKVALMSGPQLYEMEKRSIAAN